MMLIAIASDDANGLGGRVSAHFGRCTHITVVEVEGHQVSNHSVEKNPNADLHQPGTMCLFIRALGVSVVLSGGMGPRAVSMFGRHGIEVATGAVGCVGEAVEEYLQGRLRNSVPCDPSERGCEDVDEPGRGYR